MKEYLRTLKDKIFIKTKDPLFKVGDLVVVKNTLYNQYVICNIYPNILNICGLVVKVPNKYNFIYFIHIPGKEKTILAYEKELQSLDDFIQNKEKSKENK